MTLSRILHHPYFIYQRVTSLIVTETIDSIVINLSDTLRSKYFLFSVPIFYFKHCTYDFDVPNQRNLCLDRPVVKGCLKDVFA